MLARYLLLPGCVMLRIMLFVTAFAFALAGCTDSATTRTPPPDAAVDSRPSDSGTGGRTCTGKAFDPCMTNDQCMSRNCHLFNQQGFSVCTVTCSANMPCPNDVSGTPAMCNGMGICKPKTTPNACVP